MLIGLTPVHWRECRTRTPQHISPPPQNLNFVRVKQTFWQQGRGFWGKLQEGTEKFFERSGAMAQKSFWEDPVIFHRFIVTDDRKAVVLHRICVLWGRGNIHQVTSAID